MAERHNRPSVLTCVTAAAVVPTSASENSVFDGAGYVPLKALPAGKE